jgi:hypothetical protein
MKIFVTVLYTLKCVNFVVFFNLSILKGYSIKCDDSGGGGGGDNESDNTGQ